jgi:surface protein
MKNFLLPIFILLFLNNSFAQNPFITVWKTDNLGASANNQITIPTTGTGYNYNIYWEDTSNVAINDSILNLTSGTIITFPTAGVYRVKISGSFPRIWFNNTGDRQKIIDVEQWGDIIWSSMQSAFSGCNNLDVSATDTLTLPPNCFGMFSNCSLLIGNSSFNTWDTQNVTDMSVMYYNATIFNQDIGNWNTSNVTDMGSMFWGASSFNQDIGNWNTGNVTRMEYMFWEASAFNQDIGGWDTQNVTSMIWMFNGSSSFNQNIGTWLLNANVNLSGMLNNSGMDCNNYSATLVGWYNNNPSLTNRTLGAVGKRYIVSISNTARTALISNGWNIIGDLPTYNCPETPFITVWKTDYIGTSANNQITIPTTGTGYNYNIYWEDTSNVAINDSILNLTGGTTITFPTTGVYRVIISGNFPSIYFNNSGDRRKIIKVEQWGDIIWSSMQNAFWGCNLLDVTATDTLTLPPNCSSMFKGCTSLNGNSSFNYWNTQNATNMKSMFDGFPFSSNFNQNIENWNTQNVTDMSYMFNNCSSFNQDIGNWNTQNVIYMNGMFDGATTFNQDIGNWNTENAEYMYSMFFLASSFNQNIGNWNTESVTNMSSMFFGASSFNQNIGNWNTENVWNMNQMLNNSGMSVCNLDTTLIQWSQKNQQSNVNLSLFGLTYSSSGLNAIDSLTSIYNWNITSGGLVPNLDSIITFANSSCISSNGIAEINFPNFKNNSTYYVSWTGASNGFDTLSHPIILNGLNSGNHHFIISDDGICEIYSGNFTIDSLQAISISPNITNLTCHGSSDGSIQSNMSSGFNFVWSDQNNDTIGFTPNIQNLNANTYFLNITDTNNCLSFDTLFIINQPDEIQINYNVIDNAISVTVNGGIAPYDFNWTGSNNFTANSADIDNLDNGEYNLVVTDFNGCEQTVQINIDFDTKADFEKDNFKLSVFPNPGKDFFNLLIEGNLQQVQISMIDFSGRVVYEQVLLPSQQQNINTEQLPSGIYLLRFYNNEKLLLQSKWIKN